VPDVSGLAPTAAATLPAALPSFFAAVVIRPSADSSGLSFFAIEDYSSARRAATQISTARAVVPIRRSVPMLPRQQERHAIVRSDSAVDALEANRLEMYPAPVYAVEHRTR
jgi:hypothetical protein